MHRFYALCIVSRYNVTTTHYRVISVKYTEMVFFFTGSRSQGGHN